MSPSMDRAHHADAPHTPGIGSPETAGYEQRDANPRIIARLMIGLGVALTVIAGLIWMWFHFLSVWERPSSAPSAFANMRQVPEAPQLQVHPRDDLRKSLAVQQQELETYGWEDRQTGAVRIPIDRAMDLLLQTGLPVATQQGNAPLQSHVPASDGSSFSAPGPGTVPQNTPAKTSGGAVR